jgi:hypothetical protein
MDIWQIDSWDGDEGFRVVLDDKQGFKRIKEAGAFGGHYECGDSNAAFKDSKINVSIEIPHFSDELHLRLEDNLDENTDNESWGVSNLMIYAIRCVEPNCDF